MQVATAFTLLLVSGSAMAVSITSITPNSGPATGGAYTVVIRASGPWTTPVGSISVKFGVLAASGLSVSGNKLTITTIPANAVGVVTVTVTTTLDGNPTTTFTYVNNQLQVSVNSQINSVVDIQWGNATVNDSTPPSPGGVRKNTIIPYNWVAGSTSWADSAGATVSTGGAYTLSDDYVVTIRNLGTGTGATIILTATCTDAINGATTNWTNTGAAGLDTFKMQGRVLLTGTLLTIPKVPSVTFKDSGGVNPATIAPSTESQIDLVYTTPGSINKGADVINTITVTFTAQHS